MLDDYKNSQSVAYEILKNSIDNDKISHAYIFETKQYNNYYKFIISFVKSIFCINKYTNCKNCENCNQCKQIDDDNFIELKIIETSNLQIKKKELDDLQKEFSKKPLAGKRRVYLIKEAEKLNQSSSNSILKFLEEPEEGITAILITDNAYKLLSTIRSRCQIISLINEKNDNYLIENNIFPIDELDLKIKKIIDFINFYETNHKETIINMNNLYLEDFKEKEKCNFAFDMMILIYKEALNTKLNIENKYFNQYNDTLKEIASKNSVKKLCNKINLILKEKDNIKINANVNLLMDKLIINLERC